MTRVGMTARLIAGAVIAAGAGVVVAGGIAFDWMPRDVAPVSQKVAPIAADSVLTCAGPLLAIGRNATEASSITVAGTQSLVSTGDGMKKSTLKAPDVSGDGGPLRLITSASGRNTPQAAAAASTAIKADDLGGFVASPCGPALMDSWLVAGWTTTGAADLITIANPGEVPATVDLTLYGKGGETQPAGGNDVVVAAGSERVIPLAGLGVGEDAPVVRVTATGAPVRAMLQSSNSVALDVTGVDQTTALASAAKRQVITGVHVTTEQQDNPLTVVRLLAPDTDTTAQVTVIGEHGTTGPGQEVDLTGGTPAELQLPLAVGSYAVVVTADTPVVAAVWQATGISGGDDFTWAEPAETLEAGGDGALVSVPKGPSPRLDLLVDGDKAAKVTATPVGGGDAQSATVTPGQVSSLTLAEGTSYRIVTDRPVHASVAYVGDKQLATYPVSPPAAASAPVTVYR